MDPRTRLAKVNGRDIPPTDAPFVAKLCRATVLSENDPQTRRTSNLHRFLRLRISTIDHTVGKNKPVPMNRKSCDNLQPLKIRCVQFRRVRIVNVRKPISLGGRFVIESPFQTLRTEHPHRRPASQDSCNPFEKLMINWTYVSGSGNPIFFCAASTSRGVTLGLSAHSSLTR